MPLINWEIYLFLTGSENHYIMVLAIDGQELTFVITNRKSFIKVVTLSTQDNAKLLQQLKTIKL